MIQNLIEHEQKADDHSDGNDNHAEKTETSIKWGKPLKKTFTSKEIVAHGLSFFGAGYETTATTLEFISYNLATNQDVQNRLLSEVDEVLEKYVRKKKKKTPNKS